MPTLEELERIARGGPPAPLTGEDRARIAAARAVVDDALASGDAVYGVTTGIGNLASVRIGPEDAAALARASGRPILLAGKCSEPAERAYFLEKGEVPTLAAGPRTMRFAPR